MRSLVLVLALWCTEVLSAGQPPQHRPDEIPTIFVDGPSQPRFRDASQSAARHDEIPTIHVYGEGEQQPLFRDGSKPQQPSANRRDQPFVGHPGGRVGPFWPAPGYGRPLHPSFDRAAPAYGRLGQRMRRSVDDDLDDDLMDIGATVQGNANLGNGRDSAWLNGLPPAWQTSRPPIARSTDPQPFYLRKIAAADSAGRHRRDTRQPLVADPGNWWYDTDSGHPNEVSDALRQFNPYAGAIMDRQRLMDQLGAPLSVTKGQLSAYAPMPNGYPSDPYGYPSDPYGYPSGPYGYPSGPYGYPSGPYGYPSGPYGYPYPPVYY